MRIYFYPECNFNINKAKTYDVTSLVEWFDSQHKNPDDYEIVGKDGESHDSAYEAEVCAVYPRIMGGKSKGKNILKVVVGLALVLATGGTTAALFSNIGGLSMAHTLGAGLLLSGGGALLMGKMKMPSMDLSSDSATKENYQWNVGNLSTSRGVKGVTFGANVIPEGELLAYRTYGTSTLEKLTRSETYYVNEKYKTNRQEWNYKTSKYEYVYNTRRVAKTRIVDDSYLVSDDSSYLELLIGAGEGELDSITDIRINDISLSDLEMVEDVDYAIRLGSNTQTALKQTNLDSQAGYQSIGQTVPVKLNGSVTPLLITTPSDCDSCCIAFQAQNWYLYDTSSGAKNKAYIKPKIGYRLNGSTSAYTYIKTGVKEIDSGLPIKSDSAFYFQVVIKFPSNGTYQISIENDSAELNNTKGLLSAAEYSGSALPDRAAINISVDNIACYNNKEQTYPNTALIWLRIPASQTLNGSMPKVTWKQSREYIYAYDGSSYVLKPADNLAWAIYDIIAQVRKDGNTYHNEGEDVANIDFDKFVAFASFCDSIGAKGNWFLNKLDTSWSNAMSVATSCRAFIGLRSGKVCPYWDAPTEMTQIFTVGNYEDMSGVITAKKDRAKAIEATFNNEEEKFASRTVRVEIDNDHSAEAVSMTFVGLSNPVNVSKQAHYILRRNKYLVQSVKFTADIDSIVCELNDVIGIQCDLTEYGVGGRIFKVENNMISLDAPVTLESGKTYALLVRHIDGTLERNTPVETNGTFTQLTFNSAWSKPVLKGDIYSFGIANSEVRKYRVTGITRTNDLKAQIEAIEYNENVYDELAVAPYTYTNPNAGINNVTTTYTPEAVELAWDANNNTSYVNVYVDGVFYGRYQNGAQIPNINSEQLVEMFPVNEYGEEDTPVVRTISNNLPTPSTPPVPIVQSTTTGCVAEFDGIPKNENIVWLIIKEGDNELGRANILGEYMSVSIQLRSGTHTLSAYFVNQFSKSSQARTFTATPLGDIQANDISATALKLPTGSILRLSAKNCTTASIAEANGVKDVSGRGNHGQAYGGVSVVQDAEMGDCFSFDGTNDRIIVNNSNFIALFANIPSMTVSFSFINKASVGTTSASMLSFGTDNSKQLDCYINNNKLRIGGRWANQTPWEGWVDVLTVELNKKYNISVDFKFSIGKILIYLDGVLFDTVEGLTEANLTLITQMAVGARYNGTATYFNGLISNLRIDLRSLSASEIKTIYMFPDDVTFGQMTADLIGANVIKASNLVYTENIITQTAQIKDAIITNAKIADLNASKINAGTLDADRIAANAITAEKLTVTSMGTFPRCIFRICANGQKNYDSGSIIPDCSGNNNSFVLDGTVVYYNNATSNNPIALKPSTNFVKIYNKNGFTIPASGWTFFFYFRLSNLSSNPYLFQLRGSDPKNTIYLYVSNGYLRLVAYNPSGAIDKAINVQQISNETFYALYLRCTSTTSLEVIISTHPNYGALNKQSITLSTAREALSVPSSGCWLGNVNGGRAMTGYICQAHFYDYALSDDELISLGKFARINDQSAGQITADRIATDAIKSRNFSGSTDGSAFSTYGSFLDLANGNFVTPFYRLKSSSNDKECQIGAWTIKANGAFEADSWATGTSVSEKPVITVKGTFAGGLSYTELNHFCYSAYALYDPSGRYQDKTYVYLTPRGLTFERGDPPSGTVKFGIGEVDVVNPTTGSSTRWGLYVTGNAYCTNGTWTSCDENVKRDIKDVSTLDKLKSIRVKKFKYSQKAIEEKEWRKKQEKKQIENLKKGIKTEEEKMPEFKDDENSPEFIMAMAGEFNKAFGVDNGNEESINYTNAVGVCMRAIQELAEQFDNAVLEIKELKTKLKIQQDEKSDVEQEASYSRKPNSSKDADNLEFADVGNMLKNQQEEQK